MILLTGWAFSGATEVTRFVRSEESVTVRTLAQGGTHRFDLFGSVGTFPVGGRIHVMVTKALLGKEFAMSSRTSVMGILSTTLVIITTLSLTTSATFLALARMMLYVIVIETGLALDAKVTTSHEARERIAAVIVFSDFDEDELLILGWSRDDAKIKRFDLGSTTRTFGDSRMRCNSLAFFLGSPSTGPTARCLLHRRG